MCHIGLFQNHLSLTVFPKILNSRKVKFLSQCSESYSLCVTSCHWTFQEDKEHFHVSYNHNIFIISLQGIWKPCLVFACSIVRYNYSLLSQLKKWNRHSTVILYFIKFLFVCLFFTKYITEMKRTDFRVELPTLKGKICYFQLCGLIYLCFCFLTFKMEIITGPAYNVFTMSKWTNTYKYYVR